MASPHPYHPSPSDNLSLRGLIEEAELLAEAIVDTVRESLLVLDGSLRIRLASRSFYLTFHVSPEETLDRLVYEIGEGQWDIPRLRQLLEEILPHNGSFRDFEVTHEFPQVGCKTMLLNARKLRRREDQEELILLAIEDVTALQQARERDAFAAAVLRSSGEALVGLSPEGLIRSWNPAAAHLFGYTAEEVIGSSISNLAPADRQTEQRDFLTRLRTGEGMTIETVRLTKAGRPVTVILNAAPVLDRTGQVIGISAALTDITERKQMEQQLREGKQNLSALLKEKQTLVQEIHHRVKNNLQMIVSLLSLHAGQTTDPRVIEALSEAGNRVQAIARLHESLYASSNLAELNFGEYLRDLTNELQHLQGRAEISVQVFTEDIVLGMDMAIPLGLIANELILNCLKHAFPAGREGRVTVSVEYVRDSVKAGESLDEAVIRLRVEDDGIGLPSGLDIERTESLGLRLVQLLAQQLQAAVQAQTGTGLTWTVSIPPPTSSHKQVESLSGTSPHSDRGG
ncbi:MAG: PAS domain S-box protein [Acidobacteriaceae bacterium]|nr:PAS domain S-box protein [Acidobacteriaceae bacterium]